MADTDEVRRDRWEAAADWPLTAAALLFLVAYATPILKTDLAPPWPRVWELVGWLAWAMFAVDYLARLYLSRRRARFVGTHLPDLAVIALPLLRPLRLLRLVTLLNFLNRRAGDSLRGRVAVYVVGSTSLILFVSSLAVLEAEREHEGSNITTFGDALWWAMTTVTTVGYGDRYPTTVTGRFVAAGLMLAGIALLGVVTASLATWLLAKIREVEQDVESVTQRDVEALTREVQALRAEVARLRPRDPEALAPSGPSPNG